MKVPTDKSQLIFKMRHIDDRNEITCTESFIGTWQSQGYEMAGYVIAEEGERPQFEIKAADIPDNIVQDILTSSPNLVPDPEEDNS